MGYYLEVSDRRIKNKAKGLIALHGARTTTREGAYDTLLSHEELAVVIVVENGAWDAALLVVDEYEWDRAHRPMDGRARTYLVMNMETANKLAGYKP